MRFDIIGRMLLGSVIRRTLWRSPRALLVVAAIIGLALMSIGTARAQDFSGCRADNAGNGTCPDQAAAHASAVAAAQYICDRLTTPYRCDGLGETGHAPAEKRFRSSYKWSYTHGAPGGTNQGPNRYYLNGCPADAPWNPATGTCEAPCDFNAPPLTGGHTPSTGNLGFPASDPNGCATQVCSGGCAFNDPGTSSLSFVVVDGVAHCSVAGWRAAGQSCTASDGTGSVGSPPTDTDGDGTSDGFDSSPNNPGSGGGGGADGAQQPEDGQCGGPGQPECGTPGSGSGNGNTSGGGGNCETPPSSSGDAILAQIAYQTWATRCAIAGLGTSGNGNDDRGQPDWTKGNAPPVDQDNTDYVAETTRFGISLSPDMLDRQNLFGSGSCPVWTFPVYGGGTWSTASLPAWCDLIAPAMRGLVLIMGAFTALGILMGRFGV